MASSDVRHYSVPMPILSEPSGRTAGEWSWTRLDQPVVACLAHSSCLESSYDESLQLALFSIGGRRRFGISTNASKSMVR